MAVMHYTGKELLTNAIVDSAPKVDTNQPANPSRHETKGRAGIGLTKLFVRAVAGKLAKNECVVAEGRIQWLM